MMPKSERTKDVEGVITARTCNCCGHHEIGIVTPEGDYVPLKPGMRAAVTVPANRDSDPTSN